MTAKILIIDDEDLFREDLASILRDEGYECKTAADGEEGLSTAADFDPDMVFCDIVMPGKTGIEVLDEIMSTNPKKCVVMITAYGTLETAIEAFRKGASDYIMKPLLIEDVLRKITRLIDHERLLRELIFLRREVSRVTDNMAMVGRSDTMKNVLDLISKVSATRSTVLITGESGTGKELVARAIHQTGDSANNPFVAVNCAGIPEYLLESELFGHVKGSFTGAIANKEGFCRIAGDGTLFLDEIGEMAVSLQAKLLRVLEENEFVRVGETKSIPLTARVITSTNRNIRDFIDTGEFRKDLFFRIAVFEIHLPALRERRSDIPLLVEHFIRKFNNELKRSCLGVTNDVIRKFISYSWPGNIRELRNVIERAMIVMSEESIALSDLPPEIAGGSDPMEDSDELRSAVRVYEREHIKRVIEASGGNKEEAARRLGINSSTLYRKMADLDVDS